MAGRRPGRSRRLLPFLKYGFVVLVAASATLMAVANDARPSVVAGVCVVGFLVGVVIVWIAFPTVSAPDHGRRRGRDDDPPL